MDSEHDQSHKVKICFVGNSSVGKTSIISRFADDNFSSEVEPTVGEKTTDKTIKIDGQYITFRLADTQDMYGTKTPSQTYFHGMVALIAVYDQSDWDSFEIIADQIDNAF